MTKVFTIVANEVVDGAVECTLIQFSYNPEQIHDPESVLRGAIKDYLKTDEGKRQLEINCGCWNWGDVDDIPGSFFLNYGLGKITPLDVDIIVDRNESFADENYSSWMSTRITSSRPELILPSMSFATLISMTQRKSMRWASISCF